MGIFITQLIAQFTGLGTTFNMVFLAVLVTVMVVAILGDLISFVRERL